MKANPSITVDIKSTGGTDSLLSSLGGRKFVAGTLLAALIIVAGILDKLAMEQAVTLAITVYGIFVGGDSLITSAHAVGPGLFGNAPPPAPEDPPPIMRPSATFVSVQNKTGGAP